jgi:Aminotransferase class I and II
VESGADGGPAFQTCLRDDTISSGSLGQIQRAVTALQQLSHRFPRSKLRDADRHRDARQNIAGGAAGDLAFGNRPADAFGDGLASSQFCIRKDRDQFLAAVASRQVVLTDTIPQCLGHQPEHLIPDAVPVTVYCRKILTKIRAKDKENGILVVTEGLFSMDSDTPDLAALQALCHEFNATLVVDVAHDLGCLGEDGRGHIGMQNMLGKVDVVMGSFSKTFASKAASSRARVER